VRRARAGEVHAHCLPYTYVLWGIEDDDEDEDDDEHV
jgi:hypothetical protein